MDTRIYMFAKFQAKLDKKTELFERLKEMVTLTRKEPGCVFYDLHIDRESNDTFYFMECWNDQRALDFHMETSYVQAIVRDAPTLTVSGISISFMNRISP